MKWAALPLALVLFCLSGAGPAWVQKVAVAQTSSDAAMSGPIRIADSPLGLMVGDYVGYGVVFVNPVTLAVEETIPVLGRLSWSHIVGQVGGAVKVYSGF